MFKVAAELWSSSFPWQDAVFNAKHGASLLKCCLCLKYILFKYGCARACGTWQLTCSSASKCQPSPRSPGNGEPTEAFLPPCSVTPQPAAAFYCDMQRWHLRGRKTPSESLITTCELPVTSAGKVQRLNRFHSVGSWVTLGGERSRGRTGGAWLSSGDCARMQFLLLQTLIFSRLCLFKSCCETFAGGSRKHVVTARYKKERNHSK